MSVLLVALALAGAVLVWPRRCVEPGWSLRASVAGPARTRRSRLSWRSRRADRGRSRAVLRLLEAIGPAVQAGVAPAQAVQIAVRTADLQDQRLRTDLQALSDAAAGGARLGPVWSMLAAEHSVDALGEVGRAWALSEQVGTPLAEALATATSSMRARLDHDRRVQVLIAGPRATMQLLTLLPVAGALLAPLIGVPLTDVYTGPVLLLACLPGVGLLLMGRAVVARMVRRATTEQALS